MAKSKKEKQYVGLIPFNILGDQLHYPEGWPRELKAENFKEDGVYIECGWPVKFTKIYFQDKAIKYDEPRATISYSSKEKPIDVLGEVPGVIQLDNYEFEDTLTYDGYSRGRSAAYFSFLRSDGRKVTVFLTDFESIVNHMVKGKITGKFTFCKRGMNFGCKLIK
jgi:hypothetical protein